jgi:adenylosuccinate synthase
LCAPREERYTRYLERLSEGKEITDIFDTASENPTEKDIETLNEIADVVVDTQRCNSKDVFVRVVSRLEGHPSRGRGYVDVIIGAQYGSEGKGQIAGFLSKEYDLLVRVGGPNAGHSVYVPSLKGESYVHHHLPSGTLKSKAKLLIGPGAVINPKKILEEINECKVRPERLIIDRNAMIISDKDIANEADLKKAIGSTGQGVGAATARRIMKRESATKLAKDIPELRKYIGDGVEELAKAFHDNGRVLLEGTQGTGLSIYHGNYPFVTSRDTSVGGCLAEAGIAPTRLRRTIMVCRTYEIRVESPEEGTSGPMKHEVNWDIIGERSGLNPKELKRDEHTSTTKRLRRVGEFDWELLRKSCLLNSPTDIAVTFTDYISKENRKACRFEQLTQSTISFIQEVERVSGAPVSIITTGFNDRSVIDRRSW